MITASSIINIVFVMPDDHGCLQSQSYIISKYRFFKLTMEKADEALNQWIENILSSSAWFDLG